MDLRPPRSLLGGGAGGGATTGRGVWSTTVKPMRLSFFAEPAFIPGTGFFRAPADVKEATCLMTGEGSASEAKESEAKPSRSSSNWTAKARAEAGPIKASGGEKSDVFAESDVASPREGGSSCRRSSKDVEPLERGGREAAVKDLADPALSAVKKPPFLLDKPSAVDGRRGSFFLPVPVPVRDGAGFPRLD